MLVRSGNARRWWLLGAAALLAGCQQGSQQISPAGMLAFEVSLAAFPDRMALGWHGGNGAHSAIYLRFVNPAGRPEGDTVRITDATRDAYEPDVQPLGEDAVIAWYEKDPASGMSAVLAGIDRAGRLRWPARAFRSRAQRPQSSDSSERR